jgi:hypothetical protein
MIQAQITFEKDDPMLTYIHYTYDYIVRCGVLPSTLQNVFGVNPEAMDILQSINRIFCMPMNADSIEESSCGIYVDARNFINWSNFVLRLVMGHVDESPYLAVSKFYVPFGNSIFDLKEQYRQKQTEMPIGYFGIGHPALNREWNELYYLHQLVRHELWKKHRGDLSSVWGDPPKYYGPKECTPKYKVQLIEVKE